MRSAPRRLGRAVLVCSAGSALAVSAAPEGRAQTAAPITVVPPSIAPAPATTVPPPEFPTAGALEAPKGSGGLALAPSTIVVEGGFTELAGQAAAIVAPLEGRRDTLTQIYAAASAIEAAYARAGYVLVRVSVPPQDLRDGAPIRFAVIDGFVERIDVSHLPRRIQRPLNARLGHLVNLRHIRLATIEQALVLAADLPGITLRSTLSRGDQPGGTVLEIDGHHALASGAIGADNAFDPSLQTYGINAQFSLNSAFGRGEQIYALAVSGYDLSRFFASDARVRVLGAGVIVPFARGRLTVNPEVTFARTAPAPVVGAPRTIGTLRRVSLRSEYVLNRRRTGRSAVSLAIEQIDERNVLPDFGVGLSRDRYAVMRVGIAVSRDRPGVSSASASVQLSQGLGDFTAISQGEALALGVPFTRDGSGTGFTHLNASARGDFVLGHAFDLALTASGQSSFGQAQFRAEQFSLEGADGLSAYVGGITSVDEGFVARAQLNARVGQNPLGPGSALLPYVFAAGGFGRLAAPTGPERDHARFSAGNVGLGVRMVPGAHLPSIALEYAHGFSGYGQLDRVDRVNASISLRF